MNSYLLQAWIDMIEDFGSSPFIVINPDLSEREMDIPVEYMHEGFLTLNVANVATGYVIIDKETGYLSMTARYNGLEKQSFVPIESIVVVRSDCGAIAVNLPTQLTMFDDGAPLTPSIHNPKDHPDTPQSTGPTKQPFIPTIVK